MRDYKFRGKRVDNGEWVYGDFVREAFDGIRNHEFGIAEVGCYPVAVDGKTVGQYTGLKDKNGEEIYEGDIILSGGWFEPTLILRYPGGFVNVYRPACYAEAEGQCKFDSMSEPYFKANAYEIIGNVHDNPDLLGGWK